MLSVLCCTVVIKIDEDIDVIAILVLAPCLLLLVLLGVEVELLDETVVEEEDATVLDPVMALAVLLDFVELGVARLLTVLLGVTGAAVNDVVTGLNLLMLDV